MNRVIPAWSRTSVRALLLALIFAASFSLRAQSAMDGVRNDYAKHFLDPAAHAALAKALYDRGDRLTAFFLLEEARRNRFEGEEFQRAFAEAFLDDYFDNSADAEAKWKAVLETSPHDSTAIHQLAEIYVSRSDWDRAVPYVQMEIAARPDDLEPVNALAEIKRRQGDEEGAAKLLKKFESEHPESREVYESRIGRVIDNDPAAAAALVAAALKKYPEDGQFHFDAAALAEGKNDIPLAAKEFRRAAELAPQSADIQGWVGRFFLKRGGDQAAALRYYLNAYFLDPDFYDSEYAEGRIRTISTALASEKMVSWMADPSHSVRDLLADSDSAVVSQALSALDQRWSPDATPAVAAILRSDDPGLRMEAVDLLIRHTDAAFDSEIEKLLADPDLRVRGMAAYLAAHRWGAAKVVPLLSSPAELVRYDALSALRLYGGDEGAIVFDGYRVSGKEPSARMRAMMDHAKDEPVKDDLSSEE